MRDGKLSWLDQTLPSPAQIKLTGLELEAAAIAMPFAANAPLRFSGSIGPDAGALPAQPVQAAKATIGDNNGIPRLTFSGTATDQAAQVSATMAAWPLQMTAKHTDIQAYRHTGIQAYRHTGQFLLPALNGQLDAQLGLQWQAAVAGQPQALRVDGGRLSLRYVQLAQGKTSLVTLKQVVNIDLLRADAIFKGRVAYRAAAAGPVVQASGDVALEEFKANTLAPSEELLAWKALELRGLSLALDPAKATQVKVKETVLTDFFARVILTPEGRINLQDLLRCNATK